MPSPPVKSFVASTRRLSALCRVSIPESITATVTPLPESGFRSSAPAHTWSAPMLSAADASAEAGHGYSPEDVAEGFFRIANANMAQAIRDQNG